MLEMAILETQIFKNFWGPAARPLRKLAPSVLIGAPPPSFLKILNPPQTFGRLLFCTMKQKKQYEWNKDAVFATKKDPKGAFVYAALKRGSLLSEGRYFFGKL